MTFEVNFEDLAKQFNVDVERATDRGTKLISEINKLFPDSADEVKSNLFYASIGNQLFSSDFKTPLEYAKAKATEYKGIILSMGSTEDENRFEVMKCRNKFRENSMVAIQEKYMARVTSSVEREENLVDVVTEDYAYVKETKTIWMRNLDTEEWEDTKYEPYVTDGITAFEVPLWHKKETNSKEPNPFYGKPILPKYEKRAFFWMDDSFYVAKGDIGIEHTITDKEGNKKKVGVVPELGVECSVWGKKTAVANQSYKGVVSVWKEAYKAGAKVAQEKLWEIAEKLSEIEYTAKDKATGKEVTKSLYVDIGDVQDLPNYGYFVSHGTVTKAEVTSGKDDDGREWFRAVVQINDDGFPRGITLTSYYVPLCDVVEEINEGDEVVIIGERGSKKTDDKDENGKTIYRPKNTLCGIIKNPQVNDMSDALAKLKAAMKENKE